jgi:hypothetical protein
MGCHVASSLFSEGSTMNNLDHYTQEMKHIAQEASKTKGKGHGLAWLMMIVSVVVTGTMTFSERISWI